VSVLLREATGRRILRSAPRTIVNADEPSLKSSYDEMFILYSSESIENVSQLEFELINYKQDWCDNAIAGGGIKVGRRIIFTWFAKFCNFPNLLLTPFLEGVPKPARVEDR
jgi:hypothetical protein